VRAVTQQLDTQYSLSTFYMPFDIQYKQHTRKWLVSIVCLVAKIHRGQESGLGLLRKELLEYTGMYARTSIEHVGSILTHTLALTEVNMVAVRRADDGIADDAQVIV
jgi:hypothetical protein